MNYNNTAKQKFSTSKTYKHILLGEGSVVNRHLNWRHMAAKFGVVIDEDHSKLPMLYWVHKLNKRPMKFTFVAKLHCF